MKHFLLRYNRRTGEIVVREYAGADARRDALAARFRAEAERVTKDEEIVVLEASNLAEIHRTHSRYFRNLHQITTNAPDVSLSA